MSEKTVEAAVKRDIAQIALLDPQLAESGIAATAIALAREIDSGGNSATSKSMCARALQDALRDLRELAPPNRQRDRLDELADRRADRATRIARTSASKRS